MRGDTEPEVPVGSDTEILSLFDEWNAALQTGDPDRVVELYAADAILQPTVSNKVRHDHGEMRDYFVHFVAKGPSGVIDEANVRVFGDLAINSGLSTPHLRRRQHGAGALHVRVPPLRDGWQIIEHHSSRMPE
jgi:uncharacterized protein (TIGR02246 family)